MTIAGEIIRVELAMVMHKGLARFTFTRKHTVVDSTQGYADLLIKQIHRKRIIIIIIIIIITRRRLGINAEWMYLLQNPWT